ncbi:MAG: TetR/AcrR family transcriptional regulator [Verrucomicrobia bacterium]|nr:TetR/AcrR family transcriptional regulator [Verrucomicrobiota bacterium]
MKASTQTQDSQTSILDAAERAFADYGFDGASLRHIVEEAKANLATVYYHFGSKEGLMEAVFSRRFGPIHEEHFQMLRELETKYKGAAIPLEKLLEAMLMPPLRMATTPGKGETVMCLIGRVVTDPNPQVQELLRRQHRDVRTVYLDAFQRSVPRLPKADLLWRFEFVWGAFVFVLCNPSRIEKITGGVCHPSDTDALLSQMIAVFSAGFRAPAVSKSDRSPARPATRRNA